jgi:hypothetical protein
VKKEEKEGQLKGKEGKGEDGGEIWKIKKGQMGKAGLWYRSR